MKYKSFVYIIATLFVYMVYKQYRETLRALIPSPIAQHLLRNVPDDKLEFFNQHYELIKETSIVSKIKSKSSNQVIQIKYTLPGCDCSRIDEDIRIISEHKSLCSESATARGPRQNIISYTYFGTDENTIRFHLMNILNITKKSVKVYPKWTIRLHLKINTFYHPKIHPVLCDLYCKNKNVDICILENIHNESFSDFSGLQVNGRFWRFLPMLDPLVDMFMSRDIDAYVLDREVQAVYEWILSNYSYHILRDHPAHCGPMLAGLWGVKIRNVRKQHYELWKTFVYSKIDEAKHWDQTLLKDMIYPMINKYDIIQHDSYCCKRFNDTTIRPFKVRREKNGNWCGGGDNYTDMNKFVLNTSCPILCRPKLHKHWIHC